MSLEISPCDMVRTPSSHPLMTCPIPTVKVKVVCPGSFVAKCSHGVEWIVYGMFAVDVRRVVVSLFFEMIFGFPFSALSGSVLVFPCHVIRFKIASINKPV